MSEYTKMMLMLQQQKSRRLHRTGALMSVQVTDSAKLLMQTSLSEPVSNNHDVVIEPLSASTLVRIYTTLLHTVLLLVHVQNCNL